MRARSASCGGARHGTRTPARRSTFIDPANSTGLASDKNDGKTALKPVRTWNGGVIRRLATFAPRLRQTTTFTFLSGHVDNTDPVIFGPYIENGAQITIQGALPTPVATGVLGAVTAKTRATNTPLLAATVPGGGAPGQLLVNTTRGNSRAFVQRLIAGPSVQLSQPYVPQTIPATFGPPQNNAWSTGDTVQVFNLLAVNLEALFPTFADPSAGFNNALAVYQLTGLDPVSPGTSALLVSNSVVNFVECTMQRFTEFNFAAALGGAVGTNTAFLGGLLGGVDGGISPASSVFASFFGGFVSLFCFVGGCAFDGDFMFGTLATELACAPPVANDGNAAGAGRSAQRHRSDAAAAVANPPACGARAEAGTVKKALRDPRSD